MGTRRVDRARVSALLDQLLLVLGACFALPATVRWLTTELPNGDGVRVALTVLVAVPLIVVMSRFPLTLVHRSGDILIGFETCVLVFLTLTTSPLEAFCVWALGTAVANGTQDKAWRLRAFNIGLTVVGGALFVYVATAFLGVAQDPLTRLAAVLLGCGVYFAYDLVVTAASLAFEDGCSVSSVVTWGAIPMGLACFVSINTLGFLAAMLLESRAPWTVVLLVVPVATILVAVRSVSENRLAQQRLVALLETATDAPEWADDEQIERSLLVHAERTLRQTTAELRDEPAGPGEISAPIEVEGRPTRHLVMSSPLASHVFDEHDRVALEALAAVGVSAFNRRRLADEMTHLARHDVLTGLHNRSVFADRLVHALERRSRTQVAVLYLDLDGFKEVNDLLGHEAGDQLLVRVAERINACLRVGDTAARLGGDEFGILLDDLVDDTQADVVAERLLEILALPIEVGGRHVLVQASIGIALSGSEPTTAERLISSADIAMYAAKNMGKARAERFIPEMREAELARLELEAALREAVLLDQVRVHFQPVVDLESGVVVGFEALARWTHPTLGPVPPDVFIPTAERLGLLRSLGLQLLERAYDGGRRLAAAAGRPLSLGVNLSATQVTDPALADRVRELVEWDASLRLVLELTEGTLLGDDPATVAALHGLRSAGAVLAVDDFGVGYSSIGYLHRLPVEVLKVDKVIAARLGDPRSHALVGGLLAMARAMDLTVVAEGVEDWPSATALRELRCDLAQGYLFSGPLDLDGALAVASAGRLAVTPDRTSSRPHA